VKRGYCLANPAALLELPRHTSRPPEIFTPQETRRLLETAAATDPTCVPFLALGLFAGIRPEEIRRMRWRHVGVKYVEITARNSKTHRRRLVAVCPALTAWLALTPEDDRNEDVSPWPVGYQKRKRRLLEAANVRWGHDICRHSFASYHLAAGKNAPATAHELGHGSTAMLFAHYRELVTEEAAAAFWAIRPVHPEPGQGPTITRPSLDGARIG
jgi:integrase